MSFINRVSLAATERQPHLQKHCFRSDPIRTAPIPSGPVRCDCPTSHFSTRTDPPLVQISVTAHKASRLSLESTEYVCARVKLSTSAVEPLVCSEIDPNTSRFEACSEYQPLVPLGTFVPCRTVHARHPILCPEMCSFHRVYNLCLFRAGCPLSFGYKSSRVTASKASDR